jgi:hypothetical protein
LFEYGEADGDLGDFLRYLGLALLDLLEYLPADLGLGERLELTLPLRLRLRVRRWSLLLYFRLRSRFRRLSEDLERLS